jgi:hypothetical protein
MGAGDALRSHQLVVRHRGSSNDPSRMAKKLSTVLEPTFLELRESGSSRTSDQEAPYHLEIKAAGTSRCANSWRRRRTAGHCRAVRSAALRVQPGAGGYDAGMEGPAKTSRARWIPLIIPMLLALLVSYVAAFFAVSGVVQVRNSPRGAREVRHFPNRAMYTAFKPLWKVERYFHDDRVAGFAK